MNLKNTKHKWKTQWLHSFAETYDDNELINDEKTKPEWQQVYEVFEQFQVTGMQLVTFNNEKLFKMGIETEYVRKKILKKLDNLLTKHHNNNNDNKNNIQRQKSLNYGQHLLNNNETF